MLNVKKILKSAIKRKVKITEALIVSFLITGNISYALDISTDLNNDALIRETNLISQDLSINNTGIISGYHDNSNLATHNLGNGILNGSLEQIPVEGDVRRIKNITNNGAISGYYKNIDGQEKVTLGLGNGIISYSGTEVVSDINRDNVSHIGEIVNSGIISGFNHNNNSKNSEDKVIKINASGNGILSYGYKASIDTINNSGVISGSNIDDSYYDRTMSGNGIVVANSLREGNKSIINEIINNGVISGFNINNSTTIDSGKWNHNSGSGNGIFISSLFKAESSSLLKNVLNNGIISGFSINDFEPEVEGSLRAHSGVGNGISTFGQYNEIKNVINVGVISGYDNKNFSLNQFGNIVRPSVGNGISIGDRRGLNDGIETIINNGLIKGSNSAIRGDFNEVINNGILAGQIPTVSSVGLESSKDTINTSDVINKGVLITLIKDNPEDGISKIVNGTGGITQIDGIDKTIVNAPISGTDSSITSTALTSNKNIIVNGAGISKGALVVNSNFTLDDSIINGYNSAVYLENDSNLVATNNTFNGGGLKNDVAVIKGSDGNNSLTLNGNSTVNGKIELGAGDDSLVISHGIQINGSLNGGVGNDSLILGTSTVAKNSSNLNILHDISNFESINTNGDITLFETTKITGANEININDGNLLLRVNPTVKDDTGKIIGHALYENNGTLTNTNGNLVIGVNGTGENSVISMGGTTIDPSINNNNYWEDSDRLITNSLVLDAKLDSNGDINITVLEALPIIPQPPTEPENPQPPTYISPTLYTKLNKIYKSIVSAGEIGKLANTTLITNVNGDSYLETVNNSQATRAIMSIDEKSPKESLAQLLTILDQIYANNPYAYTLKSSRDSLKLFEDNLSYLTITPKHGETIVQGKAIYTGVRNDSHSSGKNYHGFDTDHRSYKTTTNTYGGIATFEYGLNDKVSTGITLGGNNQNINFKGSSKIKANSLYLGAFAKSNINNFKLIGGIGYQYTSADSERGIANKYDSFKTDDKYDINSLSAFVEGKYTYNLRDNWSIEPKIKLSYYHINQNEVNEGYDPQALSMRANKATSDTTDIEVGTDFIKTINLKNGELKNVLSLGVITTTGDRDKEISGAILGAQNNGAEFDIQGVELPKVSGKVSYNLEYEQTNGMIYTAGVSLEFSKDYNRNFNTNLGIGYKF